MGFFSTPKVVVLKESSDAKEYLRQLEELKRQASGETLKKIEKEISIVKAGIQGEENILFELKNSGMDMVVLHDIYLESQSGAYAQIDFLVLTPKINFVIECKNLFGNIEITNKGEFIRTVEYGGRKYREGLYSPITQNQRHLQVIKECKGERKGAIMRFFQNHFFDHFFKGLVVLANPRTIVDDRWAKKEVKEQVIRADQLIDVIKRMNKESSEMASSPKELLQSGETYLEMSRTQPTDYLRKFREMLRGDAAWENFAKKGAKTAREGTAGRRTQEKQVLEIPLLEKRVFEKGAARARSSKTTAVGKALSSNVSIEKICPKCGKKLVLREAKRGAYAGEKFYGCSGYPSCHYIEKL